MTKDVIVHITGLHVDSMEGKENEPIEVYTPAFCYEKNGKLYILYDEVQEGSTTVTKNKIKITGKDTLEVIKSGASNTHMLFKKDSRNETYYDTQFGQMLVGLNTKKLNIDIMENQIDIVIDYELDVNHELLASSQIRMDIHSKERGLDTDIGSMS